MPPAAGGGSGCRRMLRPAQDDAALEFQRGRAAVKRTRGCVEADAGLAVHLAQGLAREIRGNSGRDHALANRERQAVLTSRRRSCGI